MNQNDLEEIERLVDSIISKLGTAIGTDFSQSGCSSLLAEARKLQSEIVTILKRNAEGKDGNH